jgi:hypothetical protein
LRVRRRRWDRDSFAQQHLRITKLRIVIAAAIAIVVVLALAEKQKERENKRHFLII